MRSSTLAPDSRETFFSSHHPQSLIMLCTKLRNVVILLTHSGRLLWINCQLFAYQHNKFQGLSFTHFPLHLCRKFERLSKRIGTSRLAVDWLAQIKTCSHLIRLMDSFSFHPFVGCFFCESWVKSFLVVHRLNYTIDKTVMLFGTMVARCQKCEIHCYAKATTCSTWTCA